MTCQDWVRHAVERFTARFGLPPTLAATAPGRVNLIGEHTDYNDGFVLPVAIDRHVLALARPSPDATVTTIWAMDLGDGDDATAVTSAALEPPPERFARYVVGVMAHLRRLGCRVPPLQVAVTGTIPIGAGLSSSAALAVATATLLEPLGPTIGPVETALLCQRAEHEFGGTPCGIMDPLVSVAARSGHAMLIDCRELTWRHVPLPDALRLLVVDTGVAHDLATSAYAQRRATCAEAARRLGLQTLREASLGDVDDERLTAVQRRRARHVVEENRRVEAAAAALASGDLRALGRLLLEGHASLRDLYEVSCPELDELVRAAGERAADGIYGARLTGGGFGGSCVVLTAPDAVAAAEDHLCDRFRAAFGRQPGVLRVAATGGAGHVAIP